ncbi:FtsH protease activity modulator HflK [Beijerinckia indica]|uniref:Protein HflK n=1 Tax=Beijerinckia indica subsp. indica (strain ATCC 9039 / DSM 1715 / NCIMB 8712) TaxID=395963 RepID=B2ICT6_BEII9|nr:FtsH protease activity modulator HflK [Beijerinckia indica]ACB95360.1 HflK protein [Beijerinckia indica subsp. indica ATCC 9039]
MPWSNNGGNGEKGMEPSGNPWKSGTEGPWGQRPEPPSSDFGDWLRRGLDRLRQLPPTGWNINIGIGVVLLLLFLWLASGFYTVRPNEIGLNKTFGRFTSRANPGLNYNYPFPIGSVQILQVTDRNTINIGFTIRPDARHPNTQAQYDLPEESLMLTGDENIADVKFVVVWQIDPLRPEDFAFNVANQRETVKAVAESAMREVIGRSQIQRILTAERKVIEPAVQELMQKVLNDYKAGVLILQVQLQSVDPPEQVIAAFRDVTAAQQDLDRMRNEAEAYANRIVPEARGAAAAIVQEAEGYRARSIAEATGQAARFNQIYDEYKKAPQITRERLYLETLERVLGSVDKVLIDAKTGQGAVQGVLPYLPLDHFQTETKAPETRAPKAGDQK